MLLSVLSRRSFATSGSAGMNLLSLTGALSTTIVSSLFHLIFLNLALKKRFGRMCLKELAV